MIQLRGPLTLPAPARLEASNGSDTSWLEIDLRRVERNVAAIRQMLRGHESLPAPDAPNRSLPPDFSPPHTAPPADDRALSVRPRLSASASGFPVPARPAPSAGALAGPRPLICGAIKKNAYGLGAPQIAARLVRAGCDMLTVFHPSEAEEILVKAGLNVPVLLLLPMRSLERSDPLYRPAVAGRLHLAIHDRQQLEQVNSLGQTYGIRWPVHLYVDTGMSRSGLNLDQLSNVLGNLPDFRHVRIAGIYSHFATADDDPEFASKQFELFDHALTAHASQLPPEVIRHLSNSCGMLRDRRFHLDMVRPGLALLGYGPELLAPGPIVAEAPQLEHVVRWVSRVIHVQRYPRFAPVGYGSTHRLKRDSVLGVIPVGYGDGYPLALSDNATVRVHPADPQLPVLNAAVLGKVNMDQIVVDLTDLAVEDTGRLMNSAVEVISAESDADNSLPRLAAAARSHPYELLCRLNPAIPRRYLNGH